eukprot:m.345860 g.345860  ORF g.345860 m.345860 type:complete len:201 (-) comp19860_c0_seq7:1808-2410(-)
MACWTCSLSAPSAFPFLPASSTGLLMLAFSVAKTALVLTDSDSGPGMGSKGLTVAFLVTSLVACVAELAVVSVTPARLRRLEASLLSKPSAAINDSLSEPDDEKADKSPDRGLGRLLTLAKPETKLLLGGGIALLIASGTQVAGPYFFGKVIDAAASENGKHKLTQSILILGVIYIVGAVSAFIRSWLFTWAGIQATENG